MDHTFEPVRGMRDVLPDQQHVLSRVQAELEDELARWGYRKLDLPILERREWYLKKSGEELVSKLYDFVHHGRDLALRPEWTASVLRVYLNALQSEPLPLRLAYSGPVFRYERPQRVTFRQFTQVGVELIGGAAPLADAEVIQLACRGLERVGVRDYRLTIGHIGVVRSLLRRLQLADRTANVLVWNMERLRQGRFDALHELLAETNSNEPFDLGPLAALPDDQLEGLLLTMLRAVGLRLDNSTRSPEEIAARLVRKLRRDDPQPRLERALLLMQRLAALRGDPETTLERLEALFADEDVDPAPLAELRALLHLIADIVPQAQVTFDAGMGRGLHYYTGAMFEIEAADGLQLCGGGRYDDLLTAFGSRTSVPAVGFAYGLERVTFATAYQVPLAATAVLVMSEQTEFFGVVMAVANQLRERGYVALIDVRGRSLQANLRDAAKRGIGAIVICDERSPERVRWYDRAARSERVLWLTELEPSI